MKELTGMTLTIALTPEKEAQLLEQARSQGVSPDVLVRNAVRGLLANTPRRVIEKRPTRSSYGVLAKHGPASSAEEIDENRAEMFRSFARDDQR